MPDWWNADEETFLRHLVSPEEDRHLYKIPPWEGGFRWFRSPNVICLEKIRRLRKPLCLGIKTPESNSPLFEGGSGGY
jgi:hypothetical protein